VGPRGGFAVIVRIHIDRLVVDGPALRPRERRALAEALGRELTLLAAADGAGTGLATAASVPSLAAPPVAEAVWAAPAALGVAAARSIHGALAP